MSDDEETRPYVPGSDTSEAAGLSMKGINALHGKLLDLLSRSSMTDEEMQHHGGLSPNTQRPRRVELADRGIVCDSGVRRQTSSKRLAVVWQLHRETCSCSGLSRHTASPVARSGRPSEALAATPSDEVIRCALVDLAVLWKTKPDGFSASLLEVARWLRVLSTRP